MICSLGLELIAEEFDHRNIVRIKGLLRSCVKGADVERNWFEAKDLPTSDVYSLPLIL